MNSKNVKTVRRSISLGGKKFEVVDFSPAGYGPDDKMYESSFETWKSLPRGMTDVLSDGVCVGKLRGVRKFGWEDHKFGRKPKTSGQEREVDSPPAFEIYTTKENGECFHLSAFEHLGEKFWILGSKTVHMVLRDVNDLENPEYSEAQQRYKYAREMARTFFSTISDENRAKLMDFVLNNNVTLVAESISLEHAHFVRYDENHFRFFAIIDNNEGDNLTWCNPTVARSYFLDMGLKSVSRMERVDPNGDKEKRERIRSSFQMEENSEGAVVYQVDRNGCVLRLYKHKNYRYMALRAVREILKRKASNATLQNRLKNLHFEIENLDEFILKMCAFNAWVHKNLPEDKWSSLSDNFLNLLSQFEKYMSSDNHPTMVEMASSLSVSTCDQVQMMVMGFPGCGKSLLTRGLEKLIPGSIRINQDDFDGRDKSKLFHKAISDATSGNSIRKFHSLILDKSFHDQNTRSKTREAIKTKGRLVYVVFYHPEDKTGSLGTEGQSKTETGIENQAKLCIERIRSRGKGHKTLFPDGTLEENVINNVFVKQYQPLSSDEETEAELIVKVNMTHDPVAILTKVYMKLIETEMIPPSRDEANAEINRAVNHALGVEAELANQNAQSVSVRNSAKILFWGLKIDDDAIKEIKNLIASTIPSGLVMQNGPRHITLLYMGGKNLQNDSHLRAIENQKVDVTFTSFAYDDKGCALIATLPDSIELAEGKKPHVTIALAGGVKPVYSNEMLNSTNSTLVQLERPIVVTSYVNRFT